MSVQAQWFGPDFAKVGGSSRRELARGTPSTVEDFYSWGEPVLAPSGGDVVAVVDGLADNPLGTKDPQHPIAHWPGALAEMIRGSSLAAKRAAGTLPRPPRAHSRIAPLAGGQGGASVVAPQLSGWGVWDPA
jgi:hypothetical protein